MIKNRIGFMQGRLSPMVDGKIQAFPAGHWEQEFPQAEEIEIGLIEWTLDQDGLRENPLLTAAGRETIRKLSSAHDLKVLSVTGDCFMQAPFYKRSDEREALLADLEAIITSCGELGAKYIVFPLVDAGALENETQKKDLFQGLERVTPLLKKTGVQIVFESDYGPADLAALIDELDPAHFGINYDTGNSAALGFNPAEEIPAYGKRIYNVHIKDRVLGGTTVPPGTGNCDFKTVFAELKRAGYKGNFVLQTARAQDENHQGVLKNYREMLAGWITEAGLA